MQQSKKKNHGKNQNEFRQKKQKLQTIYERQRSRSRQKLKEKSHLGRPSKKQMFQNMSQNQQKQQNQQKDQENKLLLQSNQRIDNIRIAFIDFMSQLGVFKGFVFEEQQRKIFNKKIKKMHKLTFKQWTSKHEWNQDTENKKLINLGLKYGIHFELQRYKILRSIIIESCSICAQQCTQQFYGFIINIYMIISKQKKLMIPQQSQQLQVQIDKQLRQFAKKVHNIQSGQFYFMSMNFHSDLLKMSKSKRRLSAILQSEIITQIVSHIDQLMILIPYI